MTYDYKEGKKRVLEILNNKLKIEENNKIPDESNFTYENSYYGWVSAIFVDIRDSTTLFTKYDKVTVSKIIRSFTSEIIEILRPYDNLREIGIRGDCVYAIYTTPFIKDIYNLYIMTVYINTYMNMLNSLLKLKNFPEIKAGIALSTAQELVVKAGSKGSGINNLVWIGNAVTSAANFSSLANKNGNEPLIFSECAYNSFSKDERFKNNKPTWFKQKSSDYGIYYTACLSITDYDNWIEQGMK